MHGFKVAPLKRTDIRQLAIAIRRKFGLDKQLWFPVMEYAEIMIPTFDREYLFRVADSQELGSSHGLTYRNEEGVFIAIREDIYERACCDQGRDRGTVAHEIGHYHLHARAPVLHRTFGTQIRIVEDPEWQAKCFQGEFLVPRQMVAGMGAAEVAEKCGVSLDCADYQLKLYGSGR